MILYSVPQGSCYLEIVMYRYVGKKYFKAKVRWFTKPGMTFICEEKNLKILNKVRDTWEVLDLRKQWDEGEVRNEQ